MKLFGKKIHSIEKSPLFSKNSMAHTRRMFNKTGHAIVHNVIKPVGREFTHHGAEIATGALLGAAVL